MIYPEKFQHKLGFDTVVKRISELCVSAPGRKALGSTLQFSSDFAIVNRRLCEVDEMTKVLSSDDCFSLNGLTDMTPLLNAVRATGTFLSIEGFISLRSTLNAIDSVIRFFEKNSADENIFWPTLNDIAVTLQSFPEVSVSVDRTFDRFGEVKDSASPLLADIRRSLSSTQASIGSVMRRVMTRAMEGGYLEPDTSPVVRSGRLVLPVSPMNKRKIPGIVHDESASGKTFYIEPAELVEANNRIRELQIEEKREINRILKLLTDEIRPSIDDIIISTDTAGRFDFIRAKALYAVESGGLMPHIANLQQLEWYHAVNPVLEASLSRHGKKTVPLDITLSKQSRILVISGPNAGGKSVCLKTVGLIQYMTQSGILPPVYENSHFGIFDNIFIDIGDDQSIEDDLSTYSSHLRNMKHFVIYSNKSSLLLIDEFGTGTEPHIGGALAQAILKQLNERGAWGVITTHYQNLKTFADDTPGLINGSMLYDRQLMQPLFRLSIGNAGSSFAIEIARKTGLPASIIEDAEQLVGSDYINMDKFLLDIARDKRYWENKRHDIRQKEKRIEDLLQRYETDADTLRMQRRDIIADARKEAERIIAESNAAVERTIREIRETQADKERTRIARQRLATEREALEADSKATADSHPLLKKAPKNKKRSVTATPADKPKPKEITIGMNVKMDGQSTIGTVASIEGKNAMVNFSGVKIKVGINRLTPTNAKPNKTGGGISFISSQTTDASRSRQLNFSQEIDLRGMRLDEALQQMVYYLDDAIQFNTSRVRILHGTGTGALRQGIREYLKGHDGVESFHDELPQFGGAGITIVNLR